MKVKLKSDGSYGGLDSVLFPVLIEARPTRSGHGFRIYGADLQRLVGCKINSFQLYNTYFFFNHEIEVIEE